VADLDQSQTPSTVTSPLAHILKTLFGFFFIAAGGNHFLNESFYLRMMPPYLPWHEALVVLSGLAEMALGALLLIPRTSRWGAWGLVVLLIAVFPANFQMALHPETFPEFNPISLWARLPLQLVLIAWASWYTRQSALSGQSHA
jgi:uncharacterized membrane protein